MPGPRGFDLDTLHRTLPFSRICDRRLNAALEPVEATRFKVSSEEAERTNRTGRERVRQMKDNMDLYALKREAGASARVLGSRRHAATGKSW